MALTDKEKNDSLYFLGWPLKALVADSTHYQKTIANRFDDINVDIERVTRQILEQLRKLDKELEEARCRLSASQVDDITLNKDEIKCLLKERRRYRNELSRTLDIPVLAADGSPNLEVRC
jgi:hypothetical protein